MGNLLIAEAAQITILRNQWLFKNIKMNPSLKVYLKKTKAAKQKHQAILGKTYLKT